MFSAFYTADPAPLVHNCTFYITCGHDIGTTGFLLNDWYVLSSTDMVNWSDNGGPVMGWNTFSWANANAWASQMVERNGTFYWYVPVNYNGGGMAIGVATSSSPTGPFSDPIGAPLVDDAWEMATWNYEFDYNTAYTIDPTVLIDDDGQAYLYYGSFGRMVIVMLNDDMISLASGPGTFIERTPANFFEAPFAFKRNGTYYMMYAAGANPAAIQYVTSDSPMGPWSGPTQILDPLPNNGPDAATSHPGVAEFAGQWYFVYHLSDGPNGGETYKREVAVEKMYFNADGSIQPIVRTDGLSF
ncbi:MAG: family 43 glycosylhydrolase [Deltaproteobacteria bacterium]|nr:family 43 glycosylhydrolase [Deltaproteobacteria bacterium]